MTTPPQRWAGVDVGASKGFDVAVIADATLVAGPERLTQVAEVTRWLTAWQPEVVAVDSPRSPAPGHDLSRKGERDLVRARVCGIRYTPNASVLADNPDYYGWILYGLELYAALAAGEASGAWRVIECFPTATWSRLGGSRGGRPRARWSDQIMRAAGLGGLPSRMNQDARDAIGAALTARLFAGRRTEAFGDIVVPLPTG